MCRADADDCSSDRVRGADRDSGESGSEECDGAGGFGAESANGFELCDARAHGVNDAPSAEVGAESDGGVCRENDGPVIVSPGAGEFRRGNDFRAVECARDDAHGFLRVIAAMAKTVGGGREELQLAEPCVDAARGLVAQDPEDGGHEDERENKAHDRRDDDEDERLVPAGRDDDLPSRAHNGCASHTSDERMRRRCWKSPPPGEEIPDDRAEKSGDDDVLSDEVDADHTAANSFRDGGSEDESCYEVEKRGPNDGEFGRQHAGGDDGCDAVGGIVESVEEVEGEGDQDRDDEEDEIGFHEDYEFFRTTVSSTLATSSALSVASSRNSINSLVLMRVIGSFS